MRGESHSGWSEDDIIQEALLRYKARKETANSNSAAAYETQMELFGAGRGGDRTPVKPRKQCEDFKLMHAYEILKESSVFRRESSVLSKARKRQRNADQASDDLGTLGDGTCMYNVIIILIISLIILINICPAQGLDDEVQPNDSISNAGSSNNELSSLANVSNSTYMGKKAAKISLKEQHLDHSMARSHRELVESSKIKAKAVVRQVELQEQELKLKRQELAIHQQRANLAVIAVQPEGLTEIGKQLLKMQQRILFAHMQQQLEEGGCYGDQ